MPEWKHEGAARRADQTVGRRFPSLSRAYMRELFDSRLVCIDGRVARRGDSVTAGASISVARSSDELSRTTLVPNPSVPVEIVHDAGEWVAIAKPPNLHCTARRLHDLATLANGICSALPECATVSMDAREAGLANRLDFETSGVVLAARSRDAWNKLRAGFATGSFPKAYLALCKGEPRSAICDGDIDQRGDHVVVGSGFGRPALTKVAVLARADGYTLVRCTSTSGRRHQIRAHLRELGAPIIGDRLYGGPSHPQLEGLFLHAESITAHGCLASCSLPKERASFAEAMGLGTLLLGVRS